MSARLALFALAAFAIGDSVFLAGNRAFAQSRGVQPAAAAIITTQPPSPSTFNGGAYYNPGANNSVTVTDQSSTHNGVTSTSRTIQNSTPLPPPFTPNSYSLDGFTPNPPGYANAGQQSAVTTDATGENRGGGYAPQAQFAPNTGTSTAGYGIQSSAEYNGAATAGATAAQPAVNAAAGNANAVNATQSHASYNSD